VGTASDQRTKTRERTRVAQAQGRNKNPTTTTTTTASGGKKEREVPLWPAALRATTNVKASLPPALLLLNKKMSRHLNPRGNGEKRVLALRAAAAFPKF